MEDALVNLEQGTAAPAERAPNPSSRRLRTFELVLVVGFAFSLSVYGSVLVFVTSAYSSENTAADRWRGIIAQLTSLALLRYVLHRLGRGLKDLGFFFTRWTVPISILLAAISYAAQYLAHRGMELGFTTLTQRTLVAHVPYSKAFQPSAIIGSLIYLIINPFKEELIVRGYLMTELNFLTRSGIFAIAVSVLLQSTYHLYQGPVAALAHVFGFAVFAVYYQRTGRLAPVVLAHLLLDLWFWFAEALI
jgi:membrane protease YdiL (CAAX protease family)